MKQGCGISLGNWIAIGVLILGIMGFVHQQVSSTKEEINANIEEVDEKVTDLSGKLDNHVQFHLNNKLCQPNITTFCNLNLCRSFCRHILKRFFIVLTVNFWSVN